MTSYWPTIGQLKCILTCHCLLNCMTSFLRALKRTKTLPAVGRIATSAANIIVNIIIIVVGQQLWQQLSSRQQLNIASRTSKLKWRKHHSLENFFIHYRITFLVFIRTGSHPYEKLYLALYYIQFSTNIKMCIHKIKISFLARAFGISGLILLPG